MKIYSFNRDKVIILPVKLCGPPGDRWAQAILDTGATYTMFPPAVLKSIGVVPVPQVETVKIITASSIEYVPLFRIPRMEIFGCGLENIPVVSHLLPPGTPAQGLIGINVLQHFDLEIRFSSGQLVVNRIS